eukprot:TRINITY_DN19565_c0_g1_i1.p1 TRINITY_DN19565_c0_g1~~TRINITY_DN19565_c0_g1_i1.p1  ORF type:complete len:131 (+),score=10.44 TRINITY_DN19565_c0_g1_i1:354-746(+)
MAANEDAFVRKLHDREEPFNGESIQRAQTAARNTTKCPVMKCRTNASIGRTKANEDNAPDGTSSLQQQNLAIEAAEKGKSEMPSVLQTIFVRASSVRKVSVENAAVRNAVAAERNLMRAHRQQRDLRPMS